jgi:hypothetical protein
MPQQVMVLFISSIKENITAKEFLKSTACSKIIMILDITLSHKKKLSRYFFYGSYSCCRCTLIGSLFYLAYKGASVGRSF